MPQYTKKNYDPVKTSQYNREYYLKNRADKWGFKGIYGKGQSLLGGMGSTFKKYGTGLNKSARNITRNISNAGAGIQNAISKTKKDFDDGISDIRNRLAAATANGRKLTKSEAAQLRSEAKQKKEEAVRRLQSAGSKLSDKEQKARANESTERAKKAKGKSSEKANVSKYNEEGAKKGEAIMRLLNGEDEEKEEKRRQNRQKQQKLPLPDLVRQDLEDHQVQEEVLGPLPILKQNQNQKIQIRLLDYQMLKELLLRRLKLDLRNNRKKKLPGEERDLMTILRNLMKSIQMAMQLLVYIRRYERFRTLAIAT